MENKDNNKQKRKLFSPLRLSLFILILLALSFTTITLSGQSANGDEPFNKNGVDILPKDERTITAYDGEVCTFRNDSSTLTYFIPTRSEIEWEAVKYAAHPDKGNHEHVRLVMCASLCNDYERLAEHNDGRNCGPGLNDGYGYQINCGCAGADICTIEPGDNGFPEDLENIGDHEMQGYCRPDLDCNPIVHPQTHLEFGRIYCYDDNLKTTESSKLNICLAQDLGAILPIYHIGDECWVEEPNSNSCSSWFSYPDAWHIVVFDNNQTSHPSDGYYTQSPASKEIKSCIESPPPPASTGECQCINEMDCIILGNCEEYQFQAECELYHHCIWYETEEL